ncbi:hypothetical protein [Microbulbifer rhizosphaerae]|uniref:Glycine betaine/choline ABC-type transport system substrate-binding protein n=1 Tax=Microbulbifer rhizosphaerae TaxID=1562603 RepID=A0A7W4ZC38_9GAMM|nr:hypothetical protein [Microbulbifer rhizosphaerae]MBB3063059.1 glycine betaine/choline ABC-type transport system substrate-binding protein [Microbulbifer rhizosphaerae]
MLEIRRLLLTEFALQDVEDFFPFYSHPNVVRYTVRKALTSLAEAHDLLQAAVRKESLTEVHLDLYATASNHA